ncbi:MAG: DUF6804 family protein [Ignavibacteriaceae bacterium]
MKDFISQKNILKLLLAIAFLLCLLRMPFSYYQLIRLLGLVGFIYFAYLDNKGKIKLTPLIFIVAAIIINPIIKIPFGRSVWQIIDIIFSVILLLSIFLEKILSEKTVENSLPQNRIISEEEYLKLKEELKKKLERM